MKKILSVLGTMLFLCACSSNQTTQTTVLKEKYDGKML